MRVIGEIPHPDMKITVFRNADRISIKAEGRGVALICKFRDGEGVSDVAGAREWLDAPTQTALYAQLKALATLKLHRLTAFQQTDQDEFDEII